MFEIKVAENLVQRDGDFLIRDSLSSPGNYVLTCQWKNTPQHFKINKRVVAMNEAYSRVQYRFEKEGFDSVPALVRYYVGNREPVSEVVGAIIFQPINRALPLRCLEEKYGVGSIRAEAGYSERKSLTSKRLSLNIMNGHTQDHTLSRGNLLRWEKDVPMALLCIAKKKYSGRRFNYIFEEIREINYFTR